MKWVSHFSIRFLLVTTAEPDHIQKIESWLAADGEKKKVSSFQDTAKAQKGQWHIFGWMAATGTALVIQVYPV